MNRGELDDHIKKLLQRNTHIALRGESTCGKSWLRQKNLPDAIVVQCRLHKSVVNLFEDALQQLGISLVREKAAKSAVGGYLQASTEIGGSLLARLSSSLNVKYEKGSERLEIPIGHDLNNLNFIANIIKESDRRLVIEDFHYLPTHERRRFASDLKTLWDYGVFVVIIGIWSENNLLLHLNPDLASRVVELSIYWSPADLGKVIDKGATALNIEMAEAIKSRLISDSHGTVGIVQTLMLELLDHESITETQACLRRVDNREAYDTVCMAYADQLNALYQTFAQRVSKGIRQRKKSTGIYAHMLQAVMESPTDKLERGFHINDIFEVASSREARIKKPNLRTILRKIDGIQVDEEGRGLILSYDEAKDEVTVVDKRLFFYREYATVQWPWESMIEDMEAEDDCAFEGDE